jgi:hypothetical protein
VTADLAPGWLLPTVRATAWSPLLAVGVLLVGVSALLASVDRWAGGQLGIAAAGLAASVVAGLRDPAAALLAAVPTPAPVRRARRLLLLVPVAAATWLAFLWPGQQVLEGLGWPVAPALALLATALAAAAWAGTASGVVAPLAWAAVEKGSGALGQDVSEVLLAWQHHPWIVTLAAVAALLIGRDR